MYRSSSHYGWKPDLPDQRDLKYAAVKKTLAKLPPKVDLRSGCPPVYDQGQLGSCTGNAIAGAFEFELIKQKSPDFVPSRLFIYYNERVIENTVNTDSGAQIRDGIKSISTLGVCPETMWPYVIAEFDQKPFATCYAAALNHAAVSYQRVSQDINQMKGCLVEGYPFVAGFTVYNSFESQAVAQTGMMPMPAADETMVGGHAVLVVGYDDAQNSWIVRNSWGADWGMGGYFMMPYGYLTNADLSSDFWTIRVVTNNPAVQQPGARGLESGILPRATPAVALGGAPGAGGATANLKVTFKTGGDADTLTAHLVRADHTIGANDQQSRDSDGGTITFNNVQTQDTIVIGGLCTGTAILTIDVPTKQGPSPSYPAGNIFDIIIIK